MTNEQREFIETRLQNGLTLRQIFREPDCPISRATYYRQSERLEAPKGKPTRRELEQSLVGLVRDIERLNLREECGNYPTAEGSANVC